MSSIHSTTVSVWRYNARKFLSFLSFFLPFFLPFFLFSIFQPSSLRHRPFISSLMLLLFLLHSFLITSTSTISLLPLSPPLHLPVALSLYFSFSLDHAFSVPVLPSAFHLTQPSLSYIALSFWVSPAVLACIHWNNWIEWNCKECMEWVYASTACNSAEWGHNDI